MNQHFHKTLNWDFAAFTASACSADIKTVVNSLARSFRYGDPLSLQCSKTFWNSALCSVDEVELYDRTVILEGGIRGDSQTGHGELSARVCPL